jgi:preprotein translocase subunit SecD
MAKNLRWKLLFIVVVIALAVWSFYPPDQKVRLGLDLKGGVHLV